MSQALGSDRDPPPWVAEHLRLTTFISGASLINPSESWTEVAKQEPDNQIAHPKDGQTLISGVIVRPDLSDAQLALRILPGRIDWILSPLPQQEAPSPPPTLGGYAAGLEIFHKLLSPYLTAHPDQVLRLALGGAFLLPSTSRDEAVATLNRYLRFVLESPAFDFLYQINHPVRSTILPDDEKINSLTKWSIPQLDILLINLSARPQVLPASVPPYIASRLEVDINTRADRTSPLRPDLLEPLFAEFRDRTLSIIDGMQVA